MAQIIDWVGNDLWNLLNLPNPELYRLYGAYLDKDSIRRTANKYRRLLEKGEIVMPEREKPYDPKTEPLEVASRRARASKTLGSAALETTVLTIPTEHLPYHEKLQEALEAEGRINKAIITSGEWRGFIKNSEQEIEYTEPLKSNRVKFEVEFEIEPKWPLVTRVESVKLSKRERKEADKLRTSKKAVILPDLQIPFQDDKAIATALEIVRDVKPDKIILIGDLLDLAPFSKYVKEPEWAASVQPAIIEAHRLLATLRKMCPTADIAVTEGNHDSRLQKHHKINSIESLRLKRADQLDNWPVMSVPYLTAMDTLDIEYIAGYPANRYWINQNLQVRHGHLVRSKSNTAVIVAQEERVSTIFGHIHRLESQYLTHHTFGGGKTVGAWSVGCLCKIDGSVPSARSGYDLDGKPITNYENWQQGLAVVDYEDGDGPFNVQMVYINTFNNYEARYGGKSYRLKEE